MRHRRFAADCESALWSLGPRPNHASYCFDDAGCDRRDRRLYSGTAGHAPRPHNRASKRIRSAVSTRLSRRFGKPLEPQAGDVDKALAHGAGGDFIVTDEVCCPRLASSVVSRRPAFRNSNRIVVLRKLPTRTGPEFESGWHHHPQNVLAMPTSSG